MKPRGLTLGEKQTLKPSYSSLKQILVHVSSKVSVNWRWYDQANGVVEWSFDNADTAAHSVILLRNGYFFGGAYWPVYYANSNGRGASATNPNDNFGVDFLDGSKEITPLVDSGVLNNAPPLGLVTFNNSDPTKINISNSTVCFIFTLAAGESWSMLEGGFSSSMTPSGISVYEVTPLYGGNLCIGYDQQRVIDWDLQTQTSLQGYTPNPSTFNTWLLSVESDAPFDVLPYKDQYSYGQCQQPDCTSYFENALSDYKQGKYEQAVVDLLDGIDCLFTSGLVSMKDVVMDKLKKVMKGL